MSEKQDRTYPRTASDLERKYNFDRRFSEILGIANDAQTHAYNAETAIRKWSQRIGDLEGSYAQIEMRQNRITSRVATAEGNYSSIKQTVDGIHHEVFGEDGKSSIRQTVDGIYHEVFGEDGKFSSIKQTVDGIDLSVYETTQSIDNKLSEYATTEYVSGNLALTIKTDPSGMRYSELSSNVEKIVFNAGDIEIDADNFSLTADGTTTIKKGVIEKDVEILGTLYSRDVCAYKDEENNCEVGISYSNGYFSIGSTEVTQTNFYDAIIEFGSNGDLLLYASDIIELKTFGDIQFNLEGTGQGYFNGKWNFQGTVTADRSINVDTTTSVNQGIFFYAGNNQTNAIRRAGYGYSRLDIDGDWYSAGTWSFSSGETIVSDINRKHDVTNMPTEYRTLFDNLRAVVYKYNDGKSDRFHVGFIAQEVDNAITTAGLTRKDFAGLCIENEGKDSEIWSLRYSEFIALNTYEIQKLKKELAELKARIGA